MQAPTHVIAGALVGKAFQKIKPKPLRVALTAVTALFLHSVFDRIARLTYHPPNADFNDPFWVTYHGIVLAAFIAAIYFFWEDYKTGIIFSILPDLDWVIIHGSNILGAPLPYYDRPLIHTAIHYVTDHVPPFSLLQYLPDHTGSGAGIALEIVLNALMLLIIRRASKGVQKGRPLAGG